ncbi:hypothetical protein D9M69_512360 [compost metagenome]
MRLTLLMPGLLQGGPGIAGRGGWGEGQAFLRRGERAAEQRADRQCDLPRTRLLDHVGFRFCFMARPAAREGPAGRGARNQTAKLVMSLASMPLASQKAR